MREDQKELEAAIILSRLPGVGAARFRQLLEKFHRPSVALNFWQQEKASTHARQSLEKSATNDLIDKTIPLLKQKRIFARFFSQSGYPCGLMDLTEPPPIIYSTNVFKPEKYAAIVGARNAEAPLVNVVEKVVKQLHDMGYVIVSGGARGIDSMAHRAALNIGAKTIVVQATGVDVVYPRENQELFQNIKDSGGALMSEMLCGTMPHRSFFPTRNRIIAAMSEIVVVIQAAEKSGSIITGRWALKLGRQLKVKTPDEPVSQEWLGSLALIQQGGEGFEQNF